MADPLNKKRGTRTAGPTSDNERFVRWIEDFYGPSRWGSSVAEPLARAEATIVPPSVRSRPLAPLILRTLLFSAAAFLCWYAVFGGDASLQRTLSLVLRPVGIAPQATPAATTAEYLLAWRTVQSGQTLAPSDPRVLQYKALLDSLGPKCKEDRFALASAVIAAHDLLATRGVETSSLSLLTEVDVTLSAQTRRTWPTSCADVIDHLVTARIPTR